MGSFLIAVSSKQKETGKPHFILRAGHECRQGFPNFGRKIRKSEVKLEKSKMLLKVNIYI